MKIFDNQYHVLKYFVKPIMIDQIMLDHMDTVKADSVDYAKLEVIKGHKDAGLRPAETIQYIDARFDYDKVKEKFERLRIMVPKEFDEAFALNVKEGLIGDDLIPTVDGIKAVLDLQEEYEKSPEVLAIRAKDEERANIGK